MIARLHDPGGSGRIVYAALEKSKKGFWHSANPDRPYVETSSEAADTCTEALAQHLASALERVQSTLALCTQLHQSQNPGSKQAESLASHSRGQKTGLECRSFPALASQPPTNDTHPPASQPDPANNLIVTLSDLEQSLTLQLETIERLLDEPSSDDDIRIGAIRCVLDHHGILTLNPKPISANEGLRQIPLTPALYQALRQSLAIQSPGLDEAEQTIEALIHNEPLDVLASITHTHPDLLRDVAHYMSQFGRPQPPEPPNPDEPPPPPTSAAHSA